MKVVGMSANPIALAIPALCVLLASLPVRADGDVGRGERVAQRCTSCHALDEPASKPTGPHLVGIIGREAGTVADYTKYSQELKESGIVWDGETLDRWLADPAGMVRRTRMNFKVTDDGERADLIAYLMSLDG